LIIALQFGSSEMRELRVTVSITKTLLSPVAKPAPGFIPE
jgi:hypothetical protein